MRLAAVYLLLLGLLHLAAALSNFPGQPWVSAGVGVGWFAIAIGVFRGNRLARLIGIVASASLVMFSIGMLVLVGTWLLFIVSVVLYGLPVFLLLRARASR